MDCALGARRAEGHSARYRSFDRRHEAKLFLAEMAVELSSFPAGRPAGTIIVGPRAGKPTGLAVYNRFMLSEFEARNAVLTYVDVDDFTATDFFKWLQQNAFASIIYILGNNNIFHENCFVALQNVPGACVLHDSRMFEFMLNRSGPHEVARIWNMRDPRHLVSVDQVIDWQRDRKRLPHSFLESVLSRARPVIVHSLVLAEHIRRVYAFDALHYIGFALQMTGEEVRFVEELRRRRDAMVEGRLKIVMLGETEATKGCVEIVMALKILIVQGVEAELLFAGKSGDSYHSEIVSASARLGVEELVTFLYYVSREDYLEALVAADLVVQLRYSLFGQVSGPLADAAACGIPAVTTHDLAVGMELAGQCAIIPNDFSPLHIAQAIRELVAGGLTTLEASRRRWNTMASYVDALDLACDLGGR